MIFKLHKVLASGAAEFRREGSTATIRAGKRVFATVPESLDLQFPDEQFQPITASGPGGKTKEQREAEKAERKAKRDAEKAERKAAREVEQAEKKAVRDAERAARKAERDAQKAAEAANAPDAPTETAASI